MSLSKRQENYLAKILKYVEAIQQEAAKPRKTPESGGKIGGRRTAAELAKMRAAIITERKRGTSASKLAKKYGVSLAYIYMIKE